MGLTSLVLLLDGQPNAQVGTALHDILASETPKRLELIHLPVPPPPPEGTYRELGSQILRCDPKVVFLIPPEGRLATFKSLLREIRQDKERPIVVVAGGEEPGEVSEILREGAADFLSPPLKKIDVLPRLWRQLDQVAWAEAGRDAAAGEPAIYGLIGRNPAFRQQLERIEQIAKSDLSVLVSGETGTGKELFVRAIHRLSARRDRPFVPVNCGAIPVDLVESELFGHERGAFTGAFSRKRGLVEEAAGGTLFLDEIDSLPLLAQVKLLRFLQEHEYRQLGSSEQRHADVRVITATGIDVERAVAEGRLRQDLYYRLNILALALPPLRERPDDIPLLAHHFLRLCNERMRRRVTGFTPEAREQLLAHDWPGNVRELEHVVERAVAMSEDGLIRASQIQIRQAGRAPGAGQAQTFHAAKARVVAEFERTYLQGLMLAQRGNISRAAKVADKNRRALFELLRKHGIDASKFRTAAES